MPLFCGCGVDKRAAPEPPRAQTRLLLDLFKALDEKDYNSASLKIKKLKEICDSDLAISSLESFELDNHAASITRDALAKGNIDKANELIVSEIRKRGLVPKLVETQEEINALRDVARLVSKAQNPEDATDLEATAEKIIKLSSEHASFKPLESFAETKLAKAKTLLVKEKQKALEDLCADFDIAWASGSLETGTIAASIVVENPSHNESRMIASLLSKNWSHEDSWGNIDFCLNDIALFRKAANLRGIERSKYYLFFKSLPPANYRALLAKESFLSLNSPQPLDNDAVKKLNDAASIMGTSQEKSHYSPFPSSSKGFNFVNPLVYYPFYAYIPSFILSSASK